MKISKNELFVIFKRLTRPKSIFFNPKHIQACLSVREEHFHIRKQFSKMFEEEKGPFLQFCPNEFHDID